MLRPAPPARDRRPSCGRWGNSMTVTPSHVDARNERRDDGGPTPAGVARSRPRYVRLLAVLCGLSLVAAACGDDDDESTPAGTEGQADGGEQPTDTELTGGTEAETTSAEGGEDEEETEDS